MNAWNILFDIVVLLGAALLLGVLCERLKQNAVVGYLLTGLLLGPAVLDWLRNIEEVRALAELGVALLLFTIGLEFSWRRLRELGAVAIGGGSLQILLTGAGAGLLSLYAGLSTGEAVVVGAAVSLSSTAVVLRVLTTRAEMDSLHGRNALGVLLLQDIAVIPLMLVISALAEAAGGWTALGQFSVHVAQGVALVGVMFVLTRYVLPRMLHIASAYRNRDLPVILSITFSLGCAWASHALGLSPILGAFVAGMLLAESPFAQQIQADIVPLRAGFVTIFFASVGTMADLPAAENIVSVAALVLAILLGKALVVVVVILLFRQPPRAAVATGLALAQIGEFSFVLAEFGFRRGLMGAETFQLLLSASVITLLLTPYLIEAAPRLAETTVKLLAWAGASAAEGITEGAPAEHARDRVIVVGFGPAGQGAVEALRSAGVPFLVIDLNPRTVDAYRSSIPIEFGDATRPEILNHAQLRLAKAFLVTIPDPQTAGLIVGQARRIAPHVPVIARARYHIHSGVLRAAGAHRFVDEEQLVGERLGAELIELFSKAAQPKHSHG